MYYLGLDIGSSSVKAGLVDASNGKSIHSVHEPNNEMGIISKRDEWAEQDPNDWWLHTCNAIKRVCHESNSDPKKIISIGISYQMHGLVLVDNKGSVLRNSIIWCDSRAVEIGNKAFSEIGEEKCMKNLLNSPGNFTASKLKWVKDNEPEIYQKIYKYMLPGDFIAFKLSGDINTTCNGLSEGILWDFQNDTTADWLLEYYGINPNLTPDLVENFSIQGKVNKEAALETSLSIGTTITYRAGDQPNNALALNVFKNGEVAASGGTSGVLYCVTNNIKSKESSRINHFAHVNHNTNHKSLGKLLCINGAGIQYRWLRNHSVGNSYEKMNELASKVAVGSEGVYTIPFGNGAERMLNNINVGTHICNINLNKHSHGHLYRSSLEGIAFSFMYGMEILKDDGAKINVLRAGNDNLFRSKIFSNTVATLIGHEIEIYNTTGAFGAARASAVEDKDLSSFSKDLTANDHVLTYLPLKNKSEYEDAYENWKKNLLNILNNKL
jgi:xylulokinase